MSFGEDLPIFRHARAFREADDDELPRVGGLVRFDDCSFDIRQVTLLSELLRSLRVGASAQQRGVHLTHVETMPDAAKPSEGTYKSYPVFTITRPSAAVFAGHQLQLVHEWAELRGERLGELTSQLGIPWRFWAPIVDLNPVSFPRTLELLALAVRLGYHVLQPVKHYLACPRPASYSPSIQPVIRPRRFKAFPSGHAMEAFLVARLLSNLMGRNVGSDAAALDTQLQRMAARIAGNRVVAGVHFHLDSVCGRMVAESLAEYFVHRCKGTRGSGWLPRSFEGAGLKSDYPVLMSAFNRKEVMDGEKVKKESIYFLANRSIKVLRPKLRSSAVEDERALGMLNFLWQAAVAEWQ